MLPYLLAPKRKYWCNSIKGEGGNIHHVSDLNSLLVKMVFVFYFELKLQVFVITKAISRREICFIIKIVEGDC